MVKGLIVVLLILLGVQLGYTFVSPIVKNAMLEGKMKELVDNRGIMGEREMHRDLLAFAREKNIPLDESRIAIEVSNDRVFIAAHYRQTVRVWKYSREYEFFPASADQYRIKPKRRAAASAR